MGIILALCKIVQNYSVTVGKNQNIIPSNCWFTNVLERIIEKLEKKYTKQESKLLHLMYNNNNNNIYYYVIIIIIIM